jgi:hypothetical protein
MTLGATHFGQIVLERSKKRVLKGLERGGVSSHLTTRRSDASPDTSDQPSSSLGWPDLFALGEVPIGPKRLAQPL